MEILSIHVLQFQALFSYPSSRTPNTCPSLNTAAKFSGGKRLQDEKIQDPYIELNRKFQLSSPIIVLLPVPLFPSLSPSTLKHEASSRMATRNLRQRPRDEPAMSASSNNSKRDKRAMAKRGLRSLIIGVAVPLCLTATSTFLFSSTRGYGTVVKPFWHPPRWAFHLASFSTSTLMGLAAWLVWAEGGFRREPAALPLYLSQLLLNLLWGPLIFGLGAMKIGFAACVMLFFILLGCMQLFRKVNPVAGDIVKPCLAWVSFLAVFNYKLV